MVGIVQCSTLNCTELYCTVPNSTKLMYCVEESDVEAGSDDDDASDSSDEIGRAMETDNEEEEDDKEEGQEEEDVGEEGVDEDDVMDEESDEEDVENEHEEMNEEDDEEEDGDGTWEDIYGRTRSKDGAIIKVNIFICSKSFGSIIILIYLLRTPRLRPRKGLFLAARRDLVWVVRL